MRGVNTPSPRYTRFRWEPLINLLTPLAHVWVTPPGWQEVVQAMENSSYFESLEAKAEGKVPWKAVLRRFIYPRRPLSAEKRCKIYGHLATDTFFRWERLASAIKAMVVSCCAYGLHVIIALGKDNDLVFIDFRLFPGLEILENIWLQFCIR